jgi:hypothetical protein
MADTAFRPDLVLPEPLPLPPHIARGLVLPERNEPRVPQVVVGRPQHAVQTADLQRTLHEMKLTLDVASSAFPHCGAVNLFPGFSEMMAFTCRECGEAVECSG